MNTQEYIFNFKLVYSERFVCYSFSPTTSLKNFIETVKSYVHADFNFETNEEIEIVEAGQENGEQAPALISSNETLRQIYHNKHTNTSFYVRLSQSHQN